MGEAGIIKKKEKKVAYILDLGDWAKQGLVGLVGWLVCLGGLINFLNWKTKKYHKNKQLKMN